MNDEFVKSMEGSSSGIMEVPYLFLSLYKWCSGRKHKILVMGNDVHADFKVLFIFCSIHVHSWISLGKYN
jgi:hypothetical protein